MRRVVAIVAVCVMAALLRCGHDYNPFADAANARATIQSSSFIIGDTIGLFGLDTVRIAVTAAEKVDSIHVVFGSNRLCADTTVFPSLHKDLLYQFFLSYYDTGLQDIEIITHRAGGETVAENYAVHVTSPLSQNTIAGSYDQPLRLQTPSVQSTDVLYVWDFGRGGQFVSPNPDTVVSVVHAASSDTGLLWVKELRGSYQSPAVRFSFNLNDDVGPTIVCVNEGYTTKDTIYTGSTSFPLRFSITDRGLGSVYEALVDSAEFDVVEDRIYLKNLYNLDTLSGLKAIVVYAIDNAYFRNLTIDTFYVGYDPTLIQGGEGVQIAVLVPPSDSLIFSSSQRVLRGLLRNYTGERIVAQMVFSVNDSVGADTVSVLGTEIQHEWSTTVELTNSVNRVRIQAVDTVGVEMADTQLTLFYDPDFADTVAPVIVEVATEGNDLDLYHTLEESISVRLVAFDEGGGITFSLLNGDTMSSGDNGYGVVWLDTIALNHGENDLAFTVVDNNSLATETVVTVYQNAVPRVQRAPTPPSPLFVDTLYQDTIRIVDADPEDKIRIWKRRGPSNLTVDGLGNIEWLPSQDDVGTHLVEILYTDDIVTQYQSYTYTIEVKDAVNFSVPSFTTSEQQFPSYLEQGLDTLEIVLEIAASYGTPPYTFVAQAPGCESQPQIVDSTILIWAPSVNDTGYQRLYVIVSDYLGWKDTLVPIVLVVPQNQPCSLSVDYSLDTLPDGTIDITSSTQPETLTFTVHDPDYPVSEEHQVRVTYPDVEVVTGVDSSGQFLVVLDPTAGSGDVDTIIVTVTDRAGHEYADTLRVLSGFLLRKIRVNTSSLGADISEAVYDFPLLVRLDSSNFVFSRAQSDGGDLQFRKVDGTVLPHEVSYWNAASESAELWVLVDTIAANSSSQYFYMEWSRLNAANSSSSETVFDTTNGFSGVWHLNMFNDAQLLEDATAHNNDAAPQGGLEMSDLTDGMAGRALAFDGESEFAVIDSPGSKLVLDSTATLSAWANPTGFSQEAYMDIVARQHGDSWHDSYLLTINAGKPLGIFGSSNLKEWVYATVVDSGQWVHMCATRSGTSLKIYVDGEFVNEVTSDKASCTIDSNEVTIGAQYNGAVSEYFWGILDEVRIEHEARSAAWIRLSYRSQMADQSVVTIEE